MSIIINRPPNAPSKSTAPKPSGSTTPYVDPTTAALQGGTSIFDLIPKIGPNTTLSQSIPAQQQAAAAVVAGDQSTATAALQAAGQQIALTNQIIEQNSKELEKVNADIEKDKAELDSLKNGSSDGTGSGARSAFSLQFSSSIAPTSQSGSSGDDSNQQRINELEGNIASNTTKAGKHRATIRKDSQTGRLIFDQNLKQASLAEAKARQAQTTAQATVEQQITPLEQFDQVLGTASELAVAAGTVMAMIPDPSGVTETIGTVLKTAGTIGGIAAQVLNVANVAAKGDTLKTMQAATGAATSIAGSAASFKSKPPIVV